MCFRTVIQVFFAICMQAMTYSVRNVPSQQAVKLVVEGPGFVEQCWFGLFGMALQSVTPTLKLSLKMPYFPD